MHRPRIKRTVESVAAEGDLYLLHPSGDSDIRVAEPDERDRRLLDSLDGERTLGQLHEEFGVEEVDDALSQLQKLRVIENAADDDLLPPGELERFDHQLRYFSDIARGGLTPSRCQRRLREAKVAVLGLGRLGSRVASELAAYGIGEIRLANCGWTEDHGDQNSNTGADLDEAHATVLVARLRALNPAMRVTATPRRLGSEVDLAGFIHGADVVIDATDWPAFETERQCNSACFGAEIPYITMRQFPPIARVGPLYVPGRTGCFACQEERYRREYPLFDAVVAEMQAAPSPIAMPGLADGLIGALVGLEVMHLLTELCEPSTQGVAHIYDLRTMEVNRDIIAPEPDCPVCGHLQADSTDS